MILVLWVYLTRIQCFDGRQDNKRERGVLMMTNYERETKEVSRFQLEQSVPYFIEKNNRHPFWKRLMDITGSLVLIICCLPLFLLLAILIIVVSGRPIFFLQTRTGMNNTKFSILKFRTMEKSVHHEKRHMYQWTEGVPETFRFKTENDSSVTPVGKFLRKYSLDELPQLVNVLIGNMSLVGPRPEIPSITNMYNHQQFKRLLVKPGITGYAQINGRAEIDHGKKIEYDLFYVKNRSFLLDVKIIVGTIIAIIRAKGAY